MSQKGGSAFLLNLLVIRGFNFWNLNQSLPSLWTLESPLKEVEGYNKNTVEIFTFKLFIFIFKEIKKKIRPSLPKTKSLQPRIEPGINYFNSPHTTTLPRQHNRKWKKFNYTNTIYHLFVIEVLAIFPILCLIEKWRRILSTAQTSYLKEAENQLSSSLREIFSVVFILTLWMKILWCDHF